MRKRFAIILVILLLVSFGLFAFFYAGKNRSGQGSIQNIPQVQPVADADFDGSTAPVSAVQQPDVDASQSDQAQVVMEAPVVDSGGLDGENTGAVGKKGYSNNTELMARLEQFDVVSLEKVRTVENNGLLAVSVGKPKYVYFMVLSKKSRIRNPGYRTIIVAPVVQIGGIFRKKSTVVLCGMNNSQYNIVIDRMRAVPKFSPVDIVGKVDDECKGSVMSEIKSIFSEK